MSVNVMPGDLQNDHQRCVWELFCGSFFLLKLSPLNLCGKCCYVDKKEELAEEREERHFLLIRGHSA